MARPALAVVAGHSAFALPARVQSSLALRVGYPYPSSDAALPIYGHPLES